MEIFKSLEGQPLKKWDCSSEIGTVGNYEMHTLQWRIQGLERGVSCACAPPYDVATCA